MGPRSSGFEDLETGFAHMAEEEEAHEPAFNDDEEEEDGRAAKGADEEDEYAMAEREYLNEMRSGMLLSEEDEVAI